MSVTNDIFPVPDILLAQPPYETAEDYSAILKSYGLPYKVAGNYYQVGEITWVQGWVLHISVISIQIAPLLEAILPVLIDEVVPFRVIKNFDLATSTLNGRLGLLQLGKVVEIYSKTDVQASGLAEKLGGVTGKFRGPGVLTDKKIGAVLYARYGACCPVIRMNEQGNKDEYIYDSSGQLIPDRQTIPCVLPAGIAWPFRHAAVDEQPVTPGMISRKYKTMDVLKADAKGDVVKALWMKSLFGYKWCVIKQARPNANTDESGRNNADRLRWQYELHKMLEGRLALPKVFDLFEEAGSTYLVMEYIKGEGLDDMIQSRYNGRSWAQLSRTERLLLLDYAMQIVIIIERLHDMGYLHRDITPVNFLVAPRDQIYAIDLELAYSIARGTPDPPFLLGTAGFISPEQQAEARPTREQDVYSLGCTLITLLTGLLPGKFAASLKSLVIKKIAWFIGDDELADVLGHCLHSKPASRPGLAAVKKSLEDFRDRQAEFDAKPALKGTEDDMNGLNAIIQQSIRGLVIPEMLTQDMLWQSKMEQDTAYSYYQMEASTAYYGLGIGVAGAMYVLSRAHRCGYDVTPAMNTYRNSLAYIQDQVKNRPVLEHRGLYSGMAGVAVALIEGVETGLVTPGPGIGLIEALFDQGSINGYSISQGVSGEGMALLRGVGILEESFYLPKLSVRAEWLLSAQQADGGWLLGVDEKGNPLGVTGFSQGMAGIICFLAALYQRYHAERVRVALVKALQWLIANAVRKDGRMIWAVHTRSKAVDSGMSEGLVGIALCLIKGFEVLGDPMYRKAAEDVLWTIPHPLVRRDITLEGGLTGIGELYLEAAEVFDELEWRSRAASVAGFLLHQYCGLADGAVFWLTGEASFPTAGLLKGNGGIIHFLLRYAHPKKLTHSLLPAWEFATA